MAGLGPAIQGPRGAAQDGRLGGGHDVMGSSRFESDLARHELCLLALLSFALRHHDNVKNADACKYDASERNYSCHNIQYFCHCHFGLSFGGDIIMRQIIALTIFSSAHACETNSRSKFAIR
jgi:hypothetical protein